MRRLLENEWFAMIGLGGFASAIMAGIFELLFHRGLEVFLWTTLYHIPFSFVGFIFSDLIKHIKARVFKSCSVCNSWDVVKTKVRTGGNSRCMFCKQRYIREIKYPLTLHPQESICIGVHEINYGRVPEIYD